MAKILKPYEVLLDDELAQEILAIPMDSPLGDPPRTIGERVAAATAAVEAANEYLQESKLARIVANTVMKDLKKRGYPRVQVRPDGQVVLHVSYDEPEEPVKEVLVQKAKRTSTLPVMDQLREQAAEMGVDISDLGQARRAIYERLQRERAARENGQSAPPARLLDEMTEGLMPDTPIRRAVGADRATR